MTQETQHNKIPRPGVGDAAKGGENAIAQNRQGVGFACLLELSRLLSRKDLDEGELFSRVADLLLRGLKYPDAAAVRIRVDGLVYGTQNFPETCAVASGHIMVGGQCSGSLDVAYLKDEPAEFDPEEKNLISETAHRVSWFMERSREKTARARGLAANELLTDFFSCILTPSPLKELSARALEISRILTQSQHGFVGYIDPETGHLVCPTLAAEKWVESQDQGDHMVFKKFSGLWGCVLKTRQPLVVNDTLKHSRPLVVPEGHIPVRRFLGVPAIIDGNLVGIIALANKTGEYTDFDVNIMTRMSALLAVAISRVRVEESLNRANTELENRVKERTRQLTDEIAERVRAEENLRRSKEMLHAVFDGISDPLLMLDSDMSVLMLNRAAKDYFCLKNPEQILGKACFKALRKSETPCIGCQLVDAVEKRQSVTIERRGFKEPSKYEQVTIYPIRKITSATDASIVHIRDITEPKSVQRHLVQSEKLASLGYLISGIAHEINNPNNFITFNVPILKEYVQSVLPVLDAHASRDENFMVFGMTYEEFREDVFKILDNIEYGSYRINNIVSNLRAFSRKKEQAEPRWVSISEVVDNALAICQINLKRSVKSLQVSLPEDLPRIKTDPDMLAQILVNFLVNAGQAADKTDSWVRLSVWLDEKEQGLVVLEVADNGKGMDELTRERMFDPFFTTKRAGEGTGLGLSISHHLATSLGGKIEVDTEEGKGSAFRLILHL